MHTVVAQYSPDEGLMNINISQCENENVLHLLLWSDLCWSTTSQEGNSGLEFHPFVHNLSDCGFVESKLFRDGFVTFLAWWATSTLFLRSSVICFVHDMIRMTKKIFLSHLFDWVYYIYSTYIYIYTHTHTHPRTHTHTYIYETKKV